jgi:hypothetical protein
MRQDKNPHFTDRLYANFGYLRFTGDLILDKRCPGCFNLVDIDVERMRPGRQNATLDLPVIDAYDQGSVGSGVRYRQLDRLDEFPTFIREPANWQGKARLLPRRIILAQCEYPTPGTHDAGRSCNSFNDISSFHAWQEFLFSPARTEHYQRASNNSV